MVVNLSIEHDVHSRVFIWHRLAAVLEVEDAQSATANSGTVVAENQTAGLVRAPMHDRLHHAVERFTDFGDAEIRRENTYDSAHYRSGARTP
jgi:hypothetical protein